MSIDSRQKKYSTEWQNNNDQINDSIFQDEGDYIINEMPKYKYEIKVIHESPNRANRAKRFKTPGRISNTSFTIVSKPKKNDIKKQYNLYANNNYKGNYIKKLYIGKLPRTEPTIRFYPGNAYIRKNKRNITNQKSFKCVKKHKRYNNKKISKPYHYIYNYDLNNYNSNCDYIIEIFPTNSCNCQKQINKIINEFFQNEKIRKNNYFKNIKGYENGNRCNLNNKNISYVYDKDISNRENNYFYNICSPPRKRSFKEPIKIEKPINSIYYPKRINTPCNYNTSENINSNKKKNTKKINKDYYNNNAYLETSNISIPKSNKLKKIKIPKKSANNSFMSADNTKYMNMSPNNNSFINRKKYSRKNYLSPYYIKSQNLSNNLNSTTRSNGRKSSSIMINKSSERHEKIKVVQIGKKIEPLIVKKSVKKPIKEKIVNEDGSTSNVIKQTSVITSIESKPFVDKSKNENLVKENITKIYTTLTKIENEQDNSNDNNNNDTKDNNLKLNINNEIEKENKQNDKENNNLDNNIDINDENRNNNLLEANNDLLIHKNNNNSSFNYSSLYSNIYDLNEQNNNVGRINEIIKYLKYLYYRRTNLTSLEEAKEKSLSNYFLKLNNDEKIGVLHHLNDGNVENKKIYDKLLIILEGNNNGIISDDEDKKHTQNKKNIL